MNNPKRPPSVGQPYTRLGAQIKPVVGKGATLSSCELRAKHTLSLCQLEDESPPPLLGIACPSSENQHFVVSVFIGVGVGVEGRVGREREMVRMLVIARESKSKSKGKARARMRVIITIKMPSIRTSLFAERSSHGCPEAER